MQPTWTIADPICTFLFSILVMLTTIPIFIDVMGILMETTPGDIEVVDLFNAISSVSQHSQLCLSQPFRFSVNCFDPI